MSRVIWSVLPLLALWLVVAVAGWPSRRGRTAKRWRALQQPAPATTAAIDVSRSAAASIVANRMRAAVELCGALTIVLLVSFDAPRLAGTVLLLVVIWVIHRGEFPIAQRLFVRLAGHRHAGLTLEAYRYNMLNEHHGAWWRLGRRFTIAEPLRVLGSALLLSAGLVIHNNSSVIPTGISGLAPSAGDLPPSAVAGLLIVAGLVLLWSGTKLERGLRRHEMRMVTALGGARDPQQRTILFLRRFKTESIPLPRHAAARDLGIFNALVPQRSIYFEEAVVWSCWAFGAIVSIANPRQVHDSVLATGRQAVPADQDWKEAVTSLINKSAMIVLVVGKTDGITGEKVTGTRWEMATIVRSPLMAAKAVFLNAFPDRPADFQDEIERLAGPGLDSRPIRDVPSGRKLIGAAFLDGKATPIFSNLAEDVDYEAAVQWVARRAGLTPRDAS